MLIQAPVGSELLLVVFAETEFRSVMVVDVAVVRAEVAMLIETVLPVLTGVLVPLFDGTARCGIGARRAWSGASGLFTARPIVLGRGVPAVVGGIRGTPLVWQVACVRDRVDMHDGIAGRIRVRYWLGHCGAPSSTIRFAPWFPRVAERTLGGQTFRAPRISCVSNWRHVTRCGSLHRNARQGRRRQRFPREEAKAPNPPAIAW
ncbi:MAG TPA: hypothetical protein VHV82_18060 [Sporichthyaceae bacterium]|nr:hypothetical protein [Sporichthyaceae bacterium]